MRLASLLRECLASALAAKVATALVVLVTGAMCVVAILTGAQSDANRRAIRDQLQGDQSRVITVTDQSSDSVLTPAAVGAIASLSTAQSTLALSAPQDVHSSVIGLGGPVVPLWWASTEIGDAVHLVSGRMPAPGEAIVSTRAQSVLGLSGPVGAAATADGLEIPIVGIFEADPLFPELDQGVVAAGLPGSVPCASIRVVAARTEDAARTQEAMISAIGPVDPTLLLVQSPLDAARTALGVDSQLAAYSRILMISVLGAGLFFVGIVVLADVLVRRRDLGRRRTLGITRIDLVLLVIGRTLLAAMLGAGLACTICAAVLRGESAPAATLVVAVGTLAIASAALAALPPALFAATRDPVRVMRTA